MGINKECRKLKGGINMFRKENSGIFGNKIISKEFLTLEFKGFYNNSQKEFGEVVVKPDIQGVFLI